MNQVYLDSARLLMRVAPLVLVDDTSALKGGTAINFFVCDMPRLSVDLDPVFPDHTLPREQALQRINETIRQSAVRLQKQGFQTHAPIAADSGDQAAGAAGHRRGQDRGQLRHARHRPSGAYGIAHVECA
jgi:hypothetical protein